MKETNNNRELMNSGLVEYYIKEKVPVLTAVEKAIIKNNIALSFEWFVNMNMRIDGVASMKFALYKCLIQAEPRYYGNYLEILRENYKDFPDEVLEEVLLHIRSGFVPYNLVVEKLISDLTNGVENYFTKDTAPGLVFIYLLRLMRASIIGYNHVYRALIECDKVSDEIKEIAGIAHTYFSEMPKGMKEGYMEAFNSEDPVIQQAFQDNELSLFSETLIDMLSCPMSLSAFNNIREGKLPPFTKFWDDSMAGFKPTITNRARTGIPYAEYMEARKKKGLLEPTGGLGDFAIFVLGYGPNGETPQQTKQILAKKMAEKGVPESENPLAQYLAKDTENEEDVKYVVEKVTKNASNRVMSKSTFNSQPEAEKFIATVVDAAPGMLDSFEFQIWKESNGTRVRIN